MKIEKHIVTESKWTRSRRGALATALGITVSLPLAACDISSSGDDAAEPAPESSSVVEPLGGAVFIPESSSSDALPTSSSDALPTSSSDVQQPPSSSSSLLPPSSSSNGPVDVLIAGDIYIPEPSSSSAEPESSSSEVQPSSSSSDGEEVQCEEDRAFTSPFDPCLPDDYPVVSMPSTVGHIQVPLVNV
ncbi:hypothetical protein [Fibrobacter sp. UWP2]|uniref:hypothetical protein n=1 Tax=Fibrobacter sp. UWP2 TaxID=1896216 RepID=UPI00091D8E83|nr:hypothetical protein [Fibrobacter sp. UWP2]SHI81138.1 hypothetical protein SAMN05720471_10858 [Fibrobacter sp. UWP2]